MGNTTSSMKQVRLQVGKLVTVTPSDTLFIGGGVHNGNWLIYVTTTGNVRILTADGDDIIFPVVNAGWQAVLVSQVFATSTTAGLTILAGK